MPVRLVSATPSANNSPLLIKQLLLTPLATTPEREITYQGRIRYDYRTLKDRIGRLANLLAGFGVEAGRTVAMMDWDSHRYLEAFFAVPMMGSILQTVNVRLSPAAVLSMGLRGGMRFRDGGELWGWAAQGGCGGGLPVRIVRKRLPQDGKTK